MSCTDAQMLRLYMIVTIFVFVVPSQSSAIPKPDEHKSRVIQEKVLSDLDHDMDGDHNDDYDHDAFLGREDAQSFEQLSPEESLERLGIIADKIDKDQDGVVTQEELKDWIQYVQKRYIVSDTQRMWDDHEIVDDKLTWDNYKKRTYGFLEEDLTPDHPNYSYKEMMERDKRRWEKASKGTGEHLSLEEFTDFLHPEETDHMRDIVVMETLDDIDKDKDGFISLEEFIADLKDEDDDDEDDEEDDYDEDEDDEDHEWIESEKEEFRTRHDANHDGRLDLKEVAAWILPEEYEHTDSEVEHLMSETDSNKDGVLTKQEILDKHDLFVGSQATDFGEALTRHDEF